MYSQDLLAWYKSAAREFVERHAPDRIPALDNDAARLVKLLEKSDDVTICFLGQSGIGKSTLLNALAANDQSILPAGGIGPLTAQATEVHYSSVPRFRVAYHPRSLLWQLGFALEQKVASLGKPRLAQADTEDFANSLEEDDRVQMRRELKPVSQLSVSGEGEDGTEDYIKQAKHLITGDQFSQKSLPYLVDAIRIACNLGARWDSEIESDDQVRISQIKDVLQIAKEGRVYERSQGDDRAAFAEDLRRHAAGFLSPLIQRIQVGWPSPLLQRGIILVDLPGIGIAQDTYRDITKQYVREKARAVILVVDRAGPTESTVDLLRTSGYWDRLVGAADDPESDPCSMLIAVTKVDDVALEEWAQTSEDQRTVRPKKRDVFARLVEQFKPRMKSQISVQLGKIASTDNEAIREARSVAKEHLLSDLEVHPVSAPEFRRVVRDDEDDPPFIQNVDMTGIPSLQGSLIALSQKESSTRAKQIREVSERLARSASRELEIIKAQWQDRDRAEAEAERLGAALEVILAPKRKEYDRRVGAFREFLEATVQTRIRELVLEARSAAEAEVSTYLYQLRSAHWATLRASVRRGGVFYGSRAINLPDDISNFFQEPMAAVWSQKLLKSIRKRTSEFASDTATIVGEVCYWASENGGTSVNVALLENQKQRISDQVEVMRQVGKEAIDELREIVKQKLVGVIRKPIKAACDKFVNDGDDIGPGVKSRILDLFDRLAKRATEAAEKPAIEVLQVNFGNVRKEIQEAFGQWGDPLQETAELIIERHEDRLKRSDAQRRTKILTEVQEILGRSPIPSSSEPETVTTLSQ